MSYSTVQRAREADPGLREEERLAELELVSHVESRLYMLVDKLHFGAIAFTLTNLAPDRWADRRAVSVMGRIEHVESPVDAEIIALAETHRKRAEAAETPQEASEPAGT